MKSITLKPSSLRVAEVRKPLSHHCASSNLQYLYKLPDPVTIEDCDEEQKAGDTSSLGSQQGKRKGKRGLEKTAKTICLTLALQHSDGCIAKWLVSAVLQCPGLHWWATLFAHYRVSLILNCCSIKVTEHGRQVAGRLSAEQ